MATWPTNGSNVDTWDAALLLWLTDKIFANDGTFKDNFTIDTSFSIADACDIAINTTTGTKIGTATSQKLGFFNATPVDQAGNTEDLKDVLVALGFLADSGATPLNLDGGAITCGGVTMADSANIAVNETTGTKIGTATTQKLGFYNAAPIVQAANTSDIKDALVALGFIATGGATPLDLDGGQLTCGNAYPAADNTHYLGKNDDDTPFAWKGIILKDQGGTGKYYRLEVYDNALRIVDLTD
jgi:hypothetical protein